MSFESVEWERLADHEEAPRSAAGVVVPMSDERLAEIRRHYASYSKHPYVGIPACCSAHASADDVPELLAEVTSLREQLQSATVLPERWRELMAERDAARRELAEVRDEYANLEAESSRIADRAGAYRREVEELRRFVGKSTAGTAAEALRDSPVGQFEQLVAERTERFREAWQSVFDLALKMRDDSVTVKLSDGEIRVPMDCPIPDETLRAMNAMPPFLAPEHRKAANDA